MKKVVSFFAVLVAMSSFNVFANSFSNEDELNPVDELSIQEELGVTYDDSGIEVNLDHHRFLGCVRDTRECSHLARRHGFREHMTREDHRRCGRHQLACYGR